jgi:aryl-alcohol dehydrogenase-like predicted oxidoreductase
MEKARAFAEARGRTVLELALSAIVVQAGVTSVLVGARSPDQIRANVAATRWALTAEDRGALEAALA